MATQREIAEWEWHVIQHCRRLMNVSQEWRLVVSHHQRKEGGYVQLEPTPFLKLSVKPDPFLAIE